MIKIKELAKKNKTHIFFIALLFLLAIARLPHYIDNSSMPYVRDPSEKLSGTDLTNNNAVNAYILRDSIFEYKDFIPLWNPYYLSGTPFYPKGQKPIFSPLTIFLLILPSAWMAIKWDIILHLFIAGVSTYLLVNYLKQKPIYSFISSIIYMFNYLMLAELFVGHTNIVFAYAYLPFIMLFSMKAIKEKTITNSIIVAFFLAMQFHAEGPQPALYSLILFGSFMSLSLITRDFKKRAVKVATIAVISLTLFAGLSAIKLLPASEALEFGPRQEGFSYERSIRGHLTFDSFFNSIVKNGITYLPAILVLLSLPYIKKKNVLLFYWLLILTIAILSGSFIYKMMWSFLPFLDKIKDLNKGFMLLMFIGSVLASYGALFISKSLAKKTRLKEVYIASIMIILLILNLWIFAPKYPTMIDIGNWIEENDVMQYMSEDPSLFRFHNLESLGIDHGVGHFSVPLGLEDIYGYEAALWHLEYMPEYLSVANQFPAKLWGVLNVKYLTSIGPVNISGFKLEKEFDRCKICKPMKAAGPYLYKNQEFLPRAFFADHAILILGREANVKNAQYSIMATQKFDPSTTAVIKGKSSLERYNGEDIKRFSMILLLDPDLREEGLRKLEEYSDKGGLLIPDIIKGENTINSTRIDQALSSFSGKLRPLEDDKITRRSYDKIEMMLEKESSGFLILSEKLNLFPGWTAKIDNKKTRIMQADGIISAIYIPEGSNKLVLEYRPGSFVKGAWITSLTLLIMMSYFIDNYLKIKKPKAQRS